MSTNLWIWRARPCLLLGFYPPEYLSVLYILQDLGTWNRHFKFSNSDTTWQSGLSAARQAQSLGCNLMRVTPYWELFAHMSGIWIGVTWWRSSWLKLVHGLSVWPPLESRAFSMVIQGFKCQCYRDKKTKKQKNNPPQKPKKPHSFVAEPQSDSLVLCW